MSGSVQINAVVFSTVSDNLKEYLDSIREDERIEFYDIDDPSEAEQIIKQLPRVLLITSILDTDGLMLLMMLLEELKEQSKKGQFKTLMTNALTARNVAGELEQYYVTGLIKEPVNDRTLKFKMDLLIKALLPNNAQSAAGSERRVESLLAGQTEVDESTVIGGGEIGKSSAFRFSQGRARKDGERFVFESDDDGPKGCWIAHGDGESGERRWRFLQDGDDEESGNLSGWLFTGEEPELDEESGKWRFAGSDPVLSYYKRGQKQFDQVKNRNGKIDLNYSETEKKWNKKEDISDLEDDSDAGTKIHDLSDSDEGNLYTKKEELSDLDEDENETAIGATPTDTDQADGTSGRQTVPVADTPEEDRSVRDKSVADTPEEKSRDATRAIADEEESSEAETNVGDLQKDAGHIYTKKEELSDLEEDAPQRTIETAEDAKDADQQDDLGVGKPIPDEAEEQERSPVENPDGQPTEAVELNVGNLSQNRQAHEYTGKEASAADKIQEEGAKPAAPIAEAPDEKIERDRPVAEAEEPAEPEIKTGDLNQDQVGHEYTEKEILSDLEDSEDREKSVGDTAEEKTSRKKKQTVADDDVSGAAEKRDRSAVVEEEALFQDRREEEDEDSPAKQEKDIDLDVNIDGPAAHSKSDEGENGPEAERRHSDNFTEAAIDWRQKKDLADLEDENQADAIDLKYFYRSEQEIAATNEHAWHKTADHWIYLNGKLFYKGISSISEVVPLWVYRGENQPEYLKASQRWRFENENAENFTEELDLPIDVIDYLKGLRAKKKSVDAAKESVRKKIADVEDSKEPVSDESDSAVNDVDFQEESQAGHVIEDSGMQEAARKKTQSESADAAVFSKKDPDVAAQDVTVSKKRLEQEDAVFAGEAGASSREHEAEAGHSATPEKEITATQTKTEADDLSAKEAVPGASGEELFAEMSAETERDDHGQHGQPQTEEAKEEIASFAEEEKDSYDAIEALGAFIEEKNRQTVAVNADLFDRINEKNSFDEIQRQFIVNYLKQDEEPAKKKKNISAMELESKRSMVSDEISYTDVEAEDQAMRSKIVHKSNLKLALVLSDAMKDRFAMDHYLPVLAQIISELFQSARVVFALVDDAEHVLFCNDDYYRKGQELIGRSTELLVENGMMGVEIHARRGWFSFRKTESPVVSVRVEAKNMSVFDSFDSESLERLAETIQPLLSLLVDESDQLKGEAA